jgi:transketolase N-terminal domain/subunit
MGEEAKWESSRALSIIDLGRIMVLMDKNDIQFYKPEEKVKATEMFKERLIRATLGAEKLKQLQTLTS